MGVVHEYFVRDDDEQGALLLGSAERGVIGMCPITELVSLEALLMNSSGHETTTSQLMDRPDHAVVVAHDDEPWNVFVDRIADHTTALIAAAGPEQLGAALQPWSQIEEFAGQVTAGELAEVMALLQPLFRQAVHHGRHIYVRTSC